MVVLSNIKLDNERGVDLHWEMGLMDEFGHLLVCYGS